MAICIEFQLVHVNQTKAVYRYGVCGEKLDGLVEVDVVQYMIGHLSPQMPLSQIVRLLSSDTMDQAMANRVFRKVHQYYFVHQRYPKQGGYYA